MDSVYKENSPRGDLALPEPNDRLLCSLSSSVDFCDFRTTRQYCCCVRGRFNFIFISTGLKVGWTSGPKRRGGPDLRLTGGDPGYASKWSGDGHFKTNCRQTAARFCLQMLVGCRAGLDLIEKEKSPFQAGRETTRGLQLWRFEMHRRSRYNYGGKKIFP